MKEENFEARIHEPGKPKHVKCKRCERLIKQLQLIHTTLDKALGDTDITYIEDDNQLKEEEPLQWIASKIAVLIRELEVI